MKVAHFAVFSPHQCGLYHTTKDLVLGERKVGIDARFIAVSEDGKVAVQRDGSFTTESLDWAYNADVLVRHTAIPTHLQTSGKPIVMCLHGRPESSLMLEKAKELPVITAMANKADDCRYRRFVTFWPSYVDIWRRIVGEKIAYVPACVDLDEFQPLPRPGVPNILVADFWREDITPFNVICAAQTFVERHGEARLRIIGMDKSVVTPTLRLLAPIRDKIDSVHGVMRDVQSHYAWADMVVTPHVIATRVVRESLACDIPLVAGTGCQYTPYTANPTDIDGFVTAMEKCWESTKRLDKAGCWRGGPRRVAVENFGLDNAGRGMKSLFKTLLKRRSHPRKVFVDIGAHLGETVRRFYREKPDACEYEMYCFEPHLETFRQLDNNVGHIPNVNLINACAGITDGMVDFYPGAVNDNEGGTMLLGKQTGGVRYDKPCQVESIDFVRWLRANKGEHTIVKVNIEGGEYPLMEHLLNKDATGDIDQFYVQLHAHKFAHGKQRQRFQQIEARFWNESRCKNYFTNKGFYRFT